MNEEREAQTDGPLLPRARRIETLPIAIAVRLLLCGNDDQLAPPGLRHQCLLDPAFEALVNLAVSFGPHLGEEILVSVPIEVAKSR
jgi:hypothetical protein